MITNSFKGILKTKKELEDAGLDLTVYKYRAKDVSGNFGPSQIFYIIMEFAITPNPQGTDYFIFRIKDNPQIKLVKIDN